MQCTKAQIGTGLIARDFFCIGIRSITLMPVRKTAMRKFLLRIIVFGLILSIAFGFRRHTVRTNSVFRVFVTTSKAKDHIKMMAAAGPALQKMAVENNFEIDISEDTSLINEQNLSRYQVFIPLQQAPFDMSPNQQAAVQHFIERGRLGRSACRGSYGQFF